MEKRILAAQVADLTPAREERLRQAATDCGFTLKVLTKGQYDRADLQDCEVLFGNFPPADLKYIPNLKWVATASAGVDAYVADDIYPHPGVILTNSSGAYGIAIAEHLLTVTLMLLRRMREYEEGQRQKRWKYLGKIRSVFGSTVTIVGIGNIGGNFAKRCKAMGATVRGVKRTPGEKPEYIDELYLTEELDQAIQGADVVALCLPGTNQTQHIITEKQLNAMKPGAILLNIGRGTAIDQQALCQALESGHLGGAGLDVTDPEPLPPESPLWTMGKVVLTPHISGNDSLDYTTETILDLFIENLSHYVKGEPMHNVIDRKIGY